MHVNTLSVRQVKKRRERTKRQREREREDKNNEKCQKASANGK